MTKINLNGIKPVKSLFHDEKINTYKKDIPFQKIRYWPSNQRTVLAFEQLKVKMNKPLSKISLKNITDHLADRTELELSDLTNSIKANGVRVPLIVLDNHKLLDGNRRYFACSLIYHYGTSEEKTRLKKIPVLVIKSADITKIQQHKIIAEANFLSDHKVGWSLDVQARVISDYFKECKKQFKDEQKAFIEIQSVYGLRKSGVQTFLDVTKIADSYIARARSEKRKFKLKEQVLNKFVYFWEFRNKADRGRGKLTEPELKKVTPVFFKMMEHDKFSNLKQVEPMIRAIHDPHLWRILQKNEGDNMGYIEAVIRERKLERSSEDKARSFLNWLNHKDTDLSGAKIRKTLGGIAKIIKSLRK